MSKQYVKACELCGMPVNSGFRCKCGGNPWKICEEFYIQRELLKHLKKLEAVSLEGDALLLKIAVMIENLPDNPGVVRGAGAGFSISSCNLNGNWSPFFHDWKRQYKLIADKIRDSKEDDGYGLLSKLASGDFESVFKSEERKSRLKFHPKVVQNIQDLLDVSKVK